MTQKRCPRAAFPRLFGKLWSGIAPVQSFNLQVLHFLS